MICLYIYNSDS